MERIPTPLFNELARIENELAMEALDAAREAQLPTTGPMASASAKARAEVADRVARRIRDLLLPGAIVTPLHGLAQDWPICDTEHNGEDADWREPLGEPAPDPDVDDGVHDVSCVRCGTQVPAFDTECGECGGRVPA